MARLRQFSGPEPQEARGAPGSRGMGQPPDPSGHGPRPGGAAGPSEVTGVNPLPPIDPAMPFIKVGDQGG